MNIDPKELKKQLKNFDKVKGSKILPPTIELKLRYLSHLIQEKSVNEDEFKQISDFEKK